MNPAKSLIRVIFFKTLGKTLQEYLYGKCIPQIKFKQTNKTRFKYSLEHKSLTKNIYD